MLDEAQLAEQEALRKQLQQEQDLLQQFQEKQETKLLAQHDKESRLLEENVANSQRELDRQVRLYLKLLHIIVKLLYTMLLACKYSLSIT